MSEKSVVKAAADSKVAANGKAEEKVFDGKVKTETKKAKAAANRDAKAKKAAEKAVKAQTTPSVKDLFARLEAVGFVPNDEQALGAGGANDMSYGLVLAEGRTCTAKIAEAALKNVGILIVRKDEKQWQLGVADGEVKFWNGHLCVTKDAMCNAVRLWRKTIK